MTWSALIKKLRAVPGWNVAVDNDGSVHITFFVEVTNTDFRADYTPEQLEECQAFYEGYTGK